MDIFTDIISLLWLILHKPFPKGANNSVTTKSFFYADGNSRKHKIK